jgi:hypothetical protein
MEFQLYSSDDLAKQSHCFVFIGLIVGIAEIFAVRDNRHYELPARSTAHHEYWRTVDTTVFVLFVSSAEVVFAIGGSEFFARMKHMLSGLDDLRGRRRAGFVVEKLGWRAMIPILMLTQEGP